MGGANLHAYIKRDVKKTSGGRKVYRYFVIRDGKKEDLLRIPVEDLMKLLLTLKEWCGGWDLNPRRPTPSGFLPLLGPKPDPFDQARAPPLLLYSCLVLDWVFIGFSGFVMYIFWFLFIFFPMGILCLGG